MGAHNHRSHMMLSRSIELSHLPPSSPPLSDHKPHHFENMRRMYGLLKMNVVAVPHQSRMPWQPVMESHIFSECQNINVWQARTQLPGGCTKGELTKPGQQQARELGSWLRQQYIEKYGFMPPDYRVWPTASVWSHLLYASALKASDHLSSCESHKQSKQTT